MTPSQIVGEIYKERQLLAQITQLLQQQAVEKANAEYKYNKARGLAIQDFRAKGFGVNLCDSLAHGEEEVAQAKKDLSTIESLYFTTRSRLENIRADLVTLRVLLEVEKTMLKED